MAAFNSAPSSSTSGRGTYDVFLSFRGEDVRNNFIDHLFAALNQKGIYTFKDDHMLPRGELISPELLKAIEESRSVIVVFSENYANSSWCLDELLKIMECRNLIGQRVLPVFYHVDPSDVRKQKGKFGKAFQQQEETFGGDPEKLKRWKEALVTASNLSGFHFSNSDGGESEFINNIVRDVLENIKPYVLDNDLIGMETHMDALNTLLDTKATEEVHVIGIWGMGGIGKTTIAQALFRRIAYKFDGSSFIKDVRLNGSNLEDICALQTKLLRDIILVERLRIHDPDQGAEMIQQRLSNKKVLLVLDDVDNVKQKEFLAARHEWFGPGSRIIITTRDEHLLSDTHATYKPDLLHMDQAVELFCRHAFKRKSPPKEYEELSYRAIHYTGNLPLALKVLGSFFHGRHLVVWESALTRLAKAPDIENFETLKLSFDGLHVSEKKIFLDIACFFKGKDKEHVTRILDSFGFDSEIGISVLIEKSLLTVSKKKLDMHDLIQEMGWQIVRDNFPNSRIWQLEEMHDMVVRNKDLKAIQAIVLRDKEYNVYYHHKELGFSTKVFKRIKNLRLLDIESKYSSLLPTTLPVLPDELQWLCWHAYPYFSLPVARMRKLVGLEMVDSTIQRMWEGKKILPHLKFVDLQGSERITKFPDVSGAPNIERLILSNCVSLVEVHESVGHLRRLVYLDMSGCWELKRLPYRIEMESLVTLILSYCESLERFPEASPCMVQLSKIYLDHCDQLKELPSSMRNLSGLSFLSLVSCKNLRHIPNSICELKHLKSLDLHDCEKLQQLPEDLGRMENLEELSLGFFELRYSDRLQEFISFHTLTNLCHLIKLNLSWRQIEEEDFPQNLHALSALEELYLNGNSKISQLPSGIRHLSRLKLLELNQCYRLQNLNPLPSRIQMLKARKCTSLAKIGNLSEEYEWLYKIWLLDCRKLLEDKENEIYLHKMVQQSFLKKCAAVNHHLIIGIPGNNLPIWFKEQRDGCSIALELPSKYHTQIMGFAVCGVFHGDLHSRHEFPRTTFRIVNDEKTVPKSKIKYFTASPADEEVNVWMSYIPFDYLKQMYNDPLPEDWAHIEGNLVMTLTTTNGNNAVRCGGQVVYKEGVETIPESRSFISDFGKFVQADDDADHG